jgi:TENA/THI-4/PQQC family
MTLGRAACGWVRPGGCWLCQRYGTGVDGRFSQLAAEVIGRAHEEISARAVPNRFVDLLEAGGVPRERLTWLAGEQFRIVGSDQRSFALLAARFPEPPAGEMFLSLAQGELHALRLLPDFAAALGWGERDLRAYEPRPLAQAYPAYLAWSALFGTSSAVALAMLANLEEWGGYCARVAGALAARYGMPEQATGFFRFFAGSPPGFAGQAASVVAAGLAAGEDPQEAVRAALALHAYEIAFWDALAEGLS